jgi:hypothetical protein
MFFVTGATPRGLSETMSGNDLVSISNRLQVIPQAVAFPASRCSNGHAGLACHLLVNRCSHVC